MATSNTILRRLRYTPLRDIVRLRLTGRTDLRAMLDGSGLPAPAAECVGRVIKSTRLWKLEKADVAQELIAHFHDGLAAGATIDELLASFGNEKQAAKLIRRAKIRNRPWVWHATKRSAQAVILLVVVYAAMWAVLMTRHPRPSVDYVAKLNEPVLAVPENDRAWPIYRRAWIENHIWDINIAELDVSSATGSSREPLPGEPGWEKVEPFLHKYASLLDAARAGSRKRSFGLTARFWWDYKDEDQLALMGPQERSPVHSEALDRVDRLASESLTNILVPHLFYNIRVMARLLALDIWLAEKQQKGSRVTDDYRAMIGLAKQSREQSFFINQLVAVSILALADTTVMEVMERDPAVFNNDQLMVLRHDSASAEQVTRLELTAERYASLDTIQRLYSDNGKGDGTITYDGLRFLNSISGTVDWSSGGPTWSHPIWNHKEEEALSTIFPAVYFVTASRHEITEQTEQAFSFMRRDIQRPLWEVIHRQSETEKLYLSWRASRHDRMWHFPLITLLPGLGGADKTFGTARGINEAAQVVLALELYHRDHGRYPGVLMDLSPQYLPTPPIDYSTGGPLRLKIVEGKPVVYGLGKDGKDDGGVRGDSSGWPRVPETGDWVLYPPPPVEPLAASPAGK